MRNLIAKILHHRRNQDLEQELKANRKALKYAVAEYCNQLGFKTTAHDVRVFMANVGRIEREGKL